jgi:hypothetical protein
MFRDRSQIRPLAGQEMISVTAQLWLWSGGQGNWHFLTVPPEQAVEIRLLAAAAGPRRGFGSIKVEVGIGGILWRTSLFPQKSGGYILPVKASVRRDARIAAGDDVTFELLIL